MYKIIRIMCALIISTLIMTPVHAEETGNIEFILRCENTWPEKTTPGPDNNSPANIVISGLEPNKSYEVTTSNDSGSGASNGSYTADENGTITLRESSGYADHDVHVVIKGVSQINYYIDYEQLIDSSSRHQTDIEVHHDGTLVETIVGKRNQGVKTGTYTISAGSTERVVVKNRLFDAFSTNLYVGASDRTKNPFKFTAHITGLDPDDIVFVRFGDASTRENFTGIHAVNNEIVYNFDMDTNTVNGAYIASIPSYAKITITQHKNDEDFVPNYTLSDGSSSENTMPGAELTTPQIGYSSDNPYQYIQFMNLKAQAVTVSKTVEGNQGNRYKQFNFNAKIMAVDYETSNPNGVEYTGPLSIAKQDGTIEQVTPDENHVYKFKMQHGDTVKLFGFDTIIKSVTITEEDNDYQTKVAHDSEQPVDGKSVTVDIENANANIRYINSKSLIVPTGISLPVGGALFVIIGIGIIFISKRHKQVKVI